MLKHASPWTVERVGSGRLRWTSPTGRIYDDHVPETLRFVASDPPPWPPGARLDPPPPF